MSLIEMFKVKIGESQRYCFCIDNGGVDVDTTLTIEADEIKLKTKYGWCDYGSGFRYGRATYFERDRVSLSSCHTKEELLHAIAQKIYEHVPYRLGSEEEIYQQLKKSVHINE